MLDPAWYILFDNHTIGLRVEALLRQTGLRATITPTPRQISSNCGIAILIETTQADAVRELLHREAIHGARLEVIEKDIDPTRDRFC